MRWLRGVSVAGRTGNANTVSEIFMGPLRFQRAGRSRWQDTRALEWNSIRECTYQRAQEWNLPGDEQRFEQRQQFISPDRFDDPLRNHTSDRTFVTGWGRYKARALRVNTYT